MNTSKKKNATIILIVFSFNPNAIMTLSGKITAYS